MPKVRLARPSFLVSYKHYEQPLGANQATINVISMVGSFKTSDGALASNAKHSHLLAILHEDSAFSRDTSQLMHLLTNLVTLPNVRLAPTFLIRFQKKA